MGFSPISLFGAKDFLGTLLNIPGQFKAYSGKILLKLDVNQNYLLPTCIHLSIRKVFTRILGLSEQPWIEAAFVTNSFVHGGLT